MTVLLDFNDLETRRFGVKCAKLAQTNITPSYLTLVNQRASQEKISLVSARVDVSNIDQIHALESDGYKIMDTIVYYECDLACLPVAMGCTNKAIIETARPEHAEGISSLAKAVFKDYLGHYHADPMLKNADADAAYVEWAETSTKNASNEAPVYIVKQDDVISGFAAIRLNNRLEAEGILYGIHPDRRGQGLYSDLFSFTLYEALKMGCNRFIISTQINNYTVQKVWSKFGLRHFKSYYTFHRWFD